MKLAIIPDGLRSEEFVCIGTDRERFNWTYFEGEGNLKAVTDGTDVAGHPIIITPGFQKGAELAYEQAFKAVGGYYTRQPICPGTLAEGG